MPEEKIYLKLTREGAEIVHEIVQSTDDAAWRAKGSLALAGIIEEQIEDQGLIKFPDRAPADPIGFIQQLNRTARLAWLGALLEASSEEDIVDRIMLNKLTPEQHKTSRLLNEKLR